MANPEGNNTILFLDYGDEETLSRLDTSLASPLTPSFDSSQLPKLIHFVFGMQPDLGDKPFGFVHYMAIKSAHDLHPECRLIFWYAYEPCSAYWDAVKDLVEPAHIYAPEMIFGRPIRHYAHKADVVRMAVLCRYGGIYLDLDTICVRPLTPLFRGKPVMGQELAGSHADRPIQGLCNAVMIAPPNSLFFKTWWEAYRSFDDSEWNRHSVLLPYVIAQTMPDDITILPPSAFFEPTWDEAGLKTLFHADQRFPDAYCHHLWESRSWTDISRFNEDSIRSEETTYNHIARRYIDAKEYDRLKNIKAAHVASGKARLNLGSGPVYLAGWTNVDMFADAFPDIVANLERDPWPFADNSICEIRAHHILEHIGDGFEFFMREMYRVCRNGAKISISVPHPRHDWFLTDPTHVRRFMPETFYMFDAEVCRHWVASRDSKTPIALYCNIDFKVDQVTQVVDRDMQAILQQYNIPVSEQTARLLSNLVCLINVQMTVRKSAVTPYCTEARADIFDSIYRHSVWGQAEDGFSSGPGSDPEHMSAYLDLVTNYIKANKIKVVHDIGCGDFRIGSRIAARCPDTAFIGIDIVPMLIQRNRIRYANLPNCSFDVGDIVEKPIGVADLAIIRQVLQHLSNDSISKAIRNLSTYPAVLIANHDALGNAAVNADISDGAEIRSGKLDLTVRPFNLDIEALERLDIPGCRGFLDVGILRQPAMADPLL
ncbi:glycosyltransferase [Beijerinckia indica]|uniref:Glycosyltransferase sugar-binding region containing DXD motif n=1 Tax=Beijerinckia indica subsp. indica (strain ATCC 9039 / DSM 1715 / NCIMB 8712) TaxID=395963 RepID=B2IB48_BEII9|nr:glycosyltransferase [Beijerinckia indica]ACB93746.1 glycosyltransferase sugar-binding region containing DXD motif [Beijerinckia indica subsp. indica ATCC 9039]